jgi:hypothetical protein
MRIEHRGAWAASELAARVSFIVGGIAEPVCEVLEAVLVPLCTLALEACQSELEGPAAVIIAACEVTRPQLLEPLLDRRDCWPAPLLGRLQVPRMERHDSLVLADARRACLRAGLEQALKVKRDGDPSVPGEVLLEQMPATFVAGRLGHLGLLPG